MMEELIIVLCNSLVLSAVVFYPLKLSGDFTLFWLVFLTTSSIGIGAPSRCAALLCVRHHSRPVRRGMFVLCVACTASQPGTLRADAFDAPAQCWRMRSRLCRRPWTSPMPPCLHTLHPCCSLSVCCSASRTSPRTGSGAGLPPALALEWCPGLPNMCPDALRASVPRHWFYGAARCCVVPRQASCANRYGYLDFLRFAWGAQMCNQFEGQTTVVLDQQTVCACSAAAAHVLQGCNTCWIGTDVTVAGTLQALQFYGLASENKWAQLGYESTFFALFFFLAWCAGCCFLCCAHKVCSF